jgi:hypothetical protein
VARRAEHGSMALAQVEVDAFLAAEKIVPAGSAMEWRERAPWATCRCSEASVDWSVLVLELEVGGALKAAVRRRVRALRCRRMAARISLPLRF